MPWGASASLLVQPTGWRVDDNVTAFEETAGYLTDAAVRRDRTNANHMGPTGHFPKSRGGGRSARVSGPSWPTTCWQGVYMASRSGYFRGLARRRDVSDVRENWRGCDRMTGERPDVALAVR